MSRNTSDTQNMALFCDFENVALGVRDARYEHFDIGKILERLLLKGSIVVKKAYCDWERYKDFKASMHQASFEMIEIPHVSMSGKNSADIRMVVDALDLCYTKAHVDTFVVISGDSDFSPLVSKLRENNKTVIGVGVKNSSSDLLIANCDEFIFYDDLVREQRRRSSAVARSRTPVRKKTEAVEKPERGSARPDKPAKPAGGEREGRSGRREPAAALLAGAANGASSAAAAGSTPGQSAGTDAPALEVPPFDTPISDPRAEAPTDGSHEPSVEASPSDGMSSEPRRSDASASEASLYEPLTSDEAMAEPLGMGGHGGAASAADREEGILHGLDLVVETLEALLAERGEDERIWGSMVKQTLKRRNPGFNELYYGFKSFNRMLEEARDRNLIALENDDKSGGYVVRAI